MAAMERQIAKETRLNQKESEDKRQALVLDQGLRKAAREKNNDTKRHANWQSYFGGDGVVMDTSLSGAIMEEALPYMGSDPNPFVLCQPRVNAQLPHESFQY
jgi:hypothetical protein